MINDYVFYIKPSPLSDSCFKIGISALKHMSSRIGTYQNAFGPSYQERFDRVWVGPEEDIRELERLMKLHYRKQMAGTTRGFTEWVEGVTFKELEATIDEKIEQLGVLAVSPEGFTKIFEEHIESLRNMYLMESSYGRT
jgi:hypothetical protein